MLETTVSDRQQHLSCLAVFQDMFCFGVVFNLYIRVCRKVIMQKYIIEIINYKYPNTVGPPKTDGSWWRVLTKCDPQEKMSTHPSTLTSWSQPSCDKMWSTERGNGKPLQYSCLENPMNSKKRQKDRTLKDQLPSGSIVPNMLLEISGEITPERMKRRSQSKNNIQLWM